MDPSPIIAQVREAFEATPPPDAEDLRGSNEGEEPYLLEDEFSEVPPWPSLEAEFLDEAPAGYGTALHLFSRAALRYYLPAYLIADLRGALTRAEPACVLWSGFDDEKRDTAVNPRRYGTWTWFESKAQRFEMFTRGEVEAIVAYLEFVAQRERFSRAGIEQALRNYWRPKRTQLSNRRS